MLQGDLYQNTLEAFSRVDTLGMFLVLLMPLLLIWTSCIKWQFLLHSRGIRVGIIALMRFYTIGYFFNNFLPSSIGGDAARSYLLGKRIGSQTESLAAVVLERLTGLVTLIALALAGYLATPSIHGNLFVTASLFTLTLGSAAIVGLICAPERIYELRQWRQIKSASISNIVEKLGSMRSAARSSLVSKKVILYTGLYSLGFHALSVMNVYLAANVLKLDIGLAGLFAVTPIILVIAALPTTPGGLGVWEWSYSVLLLPIGAQLDDGFAIALLLRVQLIFFSIIGGVLHLLKDHTTPAQEVENADR